MSNKTGISWTDATWNPVRGCSRVSEGCRNCYAERVAARFSGTGQPYEGLARMYKPTEVVAEFRDELPLEAKARPRWTGEVRMVQEHLGDPLRWRKPRRIFVNSMSDLFHEKLTNEQIAAVFGVMAACPQHTFQVLTKRSERMCEWFRWVQLESESPLSTCGREWISAMAVPVTSRSGAGRAVIGPAAVWPLSNVWLGVSVENQAAADERIPDLLQTPAAVRFLSCEPLLVPLYLTPYLAGIATRGTIAQDGTLHSMPHPPLDWVIAGCESGPGARGCDVTWLRVLRDQCAAAEVPFFLKQAREQARVSNQLRGVHHDDGVSTGPGSKNKGGIIELPYLDGVQHAAFPEVG
jgi:protein gp37